MRYWTPSEDALLARLWVDQGLSALKCAARMGITKNSVIARVHRLGLPKHPVNPGLIPGFKPRKSPSAHAGQIRAGGSGEHVAILETPAPVVPLPGDAASSRPAAFSRCQYPHGERGDWKWCGKPVAMIGEPYCKECRSRCYVVPPRYREAA